MIDHFVCIIQITFMDNIPQEMQKIKENYIGIWNRKFSIPITADNIIYTTILNKIIGANTKYPKGPSELSIQQIYWNHLIFFFNLCPSKQRKTIYNLFSNITSLMRLATGQNNISLQQGGAKPAGLCIQLYSISTNPELPKLKCYVL
jgi:hypothetical protein